MNPILAAVTYKSFSIIILIAGPEKALQRSEKPKRFGTTKLVHLHSASFWNIIIQWTSHDDLTAKTDLPKLPMKTCEMAKINTAFCVLTEKLLVSNFIGQPNLQIILEAKSMDESY